MKNDPTYEMIEWGALEISVPVAYDMGLRYLLHKQYYPAMILFQRVKKFRPRWAENRFHLGLAYYKLGRVKSAAKEYEQLKELNAELAYELLVEMTEVRVGMPARVRFRPSSSGSDSSHGRERYSTRTMRRENFKPKVERRVQLPENLVDYLKYVQQLIEAGDESVRMSSDDLIQNEYAYGGLIEDGGDAFLFSYFPEEEITPRWDLRLTSAEIATYASDTEKEIVLWGCENPACKYLFAERDELCTDCDFHEVRSDA